MRKDRKSKKIFLNFRHNYLHYINIGLSESTFFKFNMLMKSKGSKIASSSFGYGFCSDNSK